THHLTKFRDSLARQLQIEPTPIRRQAPIRLSSPDAIRRIIDGVDRRYERNYGSSGQRRNTRCLRRNLAGGGLPDPAFWLPKPRAELRYRHCDSYGRIDVAV